MKYCPGCKEEKDLAEFSKNRKRYDGLQNYCRKCKKGQDKKYYEKDKTNHLLRVRKYRDKIRLQVWEYLSGHPCVDCGIDNPIVLEFDHISDKKASISDMIRLSRCSWDTLEIEIRKCEVRCANCHRIKTSRDRKWSIIGLLAQR